MTARGSTRAAAVAGLFYPGDRQALRDAVSELLDGAAPEAPPHAGPQPPAIVVPHAGYVYSGPTAGVAFAAVPRAPERVVLVGPAHRVRLRGVSAADFDAYGSPLGSSPVDRAAVAELEARGLTRFVPQAHAEEHCLEVMVPFIRERFGDVPLLPLLVGGASAAEVAAALDAALRPGDLLLVSTDLSHFMPYEAARRRDLATLDKVMTGDWGGIDGHAACGHHGLGAAMQLGQRRGWSPRVLDYRSSGDTAGDRRRVVGYGALVFDPPPAVGAVVGA